MGDIYRLPTTDEWEFVVRGRGQLNDVYYFGHDVSRLRDYAWFYDNSDKESHPVAQKLPLVVDGNAFYDMLGNVWEIVEPWYQGQTVQDLIRWYGHHFIETRGGSFFEPDRRMDSATIDFWGDGYKSKFTGFRLVRTNHR
jgi:formylglycine-generating enzyme required for sulfatase activity